MRWVSSTARSANLTAAWPSRSEGFSEVAQCPASAFLSLASASFLYGIYGTRGHALGAIAGAIALLVLVVFCLIPAHTVAWLRRTRSAP